MENEEQTQDLKSNLQNQELTDPDLLHLRKSDLYSVETVVYRLIKHYRLKVRGDAPIMGVMAEIKDQKADGFEVELGHDTNTDTVVLLVNKTDELTDLSQLRQLIGDPQ